ncbi:efflux RND transporter periplasmic adaptor subunit [Thermodesulfobacteriota bacterium]
MDKKDFLGIGIVIVIGIIIGFFIILSEPTTVVSDDHGHGHGSDGHDQDKTAGAKHVRLASDDHGHDKDSDDDHGHKDEKAHGHDDEADHKAESKHRAEESEEHGHKDDGPKASKVKRAKASGADHGHDEDSDDDHGHKDEKAHGHDDEADHKAESKHRAKESEKHGHKDDEPKASKVKRAKASGDDHGHAKDSDDDHGHEAEKGHGHAHGDDDHDKGPKGGRLLKKDDLQIEVTIHENGVPPRFRIYAYENGKPIDPKELDLEVELYRLGNRVTHFPMSPEKSYLTSDKEVEEPHSFDVHVEAKWKGKEYAMQYSQVEGRVQLDKDAAKRAGIKVLSAGPARIESTFQLPGGIVLNADRVCHVVPQVPGIIAKIMKDLGDPVKKGEVIAVLHSRELAEAKSNYLVFLKREELARTNFKRVKRLWEKRVSPEKEFLDTRQALAEAEIELMAAGQKLMALGLTRQEVTKVVDAPSEELTRYEVEAPFDGVMITKHMSVGEWVKEDREICVVADLSTVWAHIIVYPKDLGLIRPGQKVTIESDASGLKTSGVISYIEPVIGEDSRTARARVVIPNPDGRWRPGLFITAQIIQEELSVPIAVETEAIQSLRDWSVVFVRYGNQFEARPLVLGRKDKHHVEVIKGLSAGEKYAARNSFLLKSELGTAGLSHTH